MTTPMTTSTPILSGRTPSCSSCLPASTQWETFRFVGDSSSVVSPNQVNSSAERAHAALGGKGESMLPHVIKGMCSNKALLLLTQLPDGRFTLPPGVTTPDRMRRGVLDLFSGCKRFAKYMLKAGAPWVICYDDLDDPVVQNLLGGRKLTSCVTRRLSTLWGRARFGRL